MRHAIPCETSLYSHFNIPTYPVHYTLNATVRDESNYTDPKCWIEVGRRHTDIVFKFHALICIFGPLNATKCSKYLFTTRHRLSNHIKTSFMFKLYKGLSKNPQIKQLTTTLNSYWGGEIVIVDAGVLFDKRNVSTEGGGIGRRSEKHSGFPRHGNNGDSNSWRPILSEGGRKGGGGRGWRGKAGTAAAADGIKGGGHCGTDTSLATAALQ